MVKSLIRVGDLDDVFGWTAHDEHVRKIRESAPPLTEEQATAIRKVFLDYLSEREAWRRRPGGARGVTDATSTGVVSAVLRCLT